MTALALVAQAASAASWQIVDDFQGGAGGAAAQAIGKDSSGNLYAAGSAAVDVNGDDAAVIRKSSDGGLTWSVVDFFSNGEPPMPLSDGLWYDVEYYAVGADANGNIYAAGSYVDDFADGYQHWFARRSADGGLTWANSDNVLGGQAAGFAADTLGNVYVVGNAGQAWIVRKGTPDGLGGVVWTTVDQFSSSLQGASAAAVFCHPTAGVFVAGNFPSKNIDRLISGGSRYIPAWVVRRSLDGGASWSTVDTYQLDSSSYSFAYGLGADAQGRIYAVGRSSGYWTVRRSATGGGSWATVDQFQILSTKKTSHDVISAIAHGFAADSAGNLFVAGWANSSLGGEWIVRENPGGTGSWQTVDTFQYAAGSYASSAALTGDTAGHVLVAGSGNAPAGVNGGTHWIVRKR
jgi:hypothetical protein